MTNLPENNELIDLNEPEPQSENTAETREVDGSETFTNAESFLSTIPGYRKEIDAEFSPRIDDKETYVRYDWFKSPLTHFIVFILFVLTTWKLVSWGYPIITELIVNEDYRHVPHYMFLCILPLLAYLWFLKYRYNPGWNANDDKRHYGSDRLTWPWR